MCACARVWSCACDMPQPMYGRQMTTHRCHVSPFATRVPGIKIRSSGLAESTLFLRHVGSPFSIYHTKLTEPKAYKSDVHKTASKCSLLYDVLYLDF